MLINQAQEKRLYYKTYKTSLNLMGLSKRLWRAVLRTSWDCSVYLIGVNWRPLVFSQIITLLNFSQCAHVNTHNHLPELTLFSRHEILNKQNSLEASRKKRLFLNKQSTLYNVRWSNMVLNESCVTLCTSIKLFRRQQIWLETEF